MAQLRRSSEKRAALVEPPQRSQKSYLLSSNLFRLGGSKACASILGVPVTDTTSTGPHVRAALLLAVSGLPQPPLDARSARGTDGFNQLRLAHLAASTDV